MWSFFRAAARVLALLTIAFPVFGQSLEQKLDAYLKAAVEVNHFQGSVLVASDGKVVLSKGYGPADITSGVPNTDSTCHLIGSITKQFTAAAVMRLVEQGKIDLQAPLTTYLPDYPKATGDIVTIHHLLNHTSGIPSYTDMPAMATDRFSPRTLDEIVSMFKDRPLEFEPGTNWKYNNSGYFLLGLILEKVTGVPYAQYIEADVLRPAGMLHSGYLNLAQPPRNLAAPHTLDSTGKQTIPGRMTDMSWPFAAGGLYATVGDLFAWDQALRSDRIVSADSRAKRYTPGLNSYGYGMVIDSMYGKLRVIHGGGIDGFLTMLERYPEDSTCIVVLGNNDGVPVGGIATALAGICFDQPYDLPIKRSAIAMDSVALQEYVGAFEVEPGTYRVITRSADSLFAQRTGGSTSYILPEDKDRFFYDYDNSIILTFLRGPDGAIDAHRIRQTGKESTAQRIIGPIADSLLASFKSITVDPAVLATYVGEYELFPGFTLTITLDGERIFCQGTGQPKIELHALSPEKFRIREVAAEITFERGPEGSVGSLVLFQNGQRIPGKRIK